MKIKVTSFHHKNEIRMELLWSNQSKGTDSRSW